MQKLKKKITYCGVCNSELSLDPFFCHQCGPPELPKEEPEEIGISFNKAIARIIILVGLFIAVSFVKLNNQPENVFSQQQPNNQIINLPEIKKTGKTKFRTIHTITAPLVNVRSKPSMDGKIILVTQKGVNFEIIASDENWSKVRVINKVGWIFNELFKSEVVTE